ncbi:MAG: hypothetical protein JWQ01_3966 [Massilia sp.]|jgi:hypothetical protein|nr:hypothetical protein [Massilia sp.]
MNSSTNFSAIAELNLDPIKVKVMHKESGEGWSREKVDAIEFEYRRFLHLMKLFPHEQVAPLFDVDIFWHYHILDTMKYAADCEQIFGYFLHHFPYSGLRGEDDEAVHESIGARMQELYEATFGEAYIRQQAMGETAFSQPTVSNLAFSQPAISKIAFSQPTIAKTAFSQPTVAKIAFSQPTIAKTAFSQPTVAKTAFSQPTIATQGSPHVTSQNDGFYPEDSASESALTAASSQAQKALASFNWSRPVLGYAA